MSQTDPDFLKPGSKSLRKHVAMGAVIALLSAGAGFSAGAWWARLNVLPPLATVLVHEAGLEFVARLDTGATVSSINAQEIAVIGGGDEPSREDAGKMARFFLVNHDGERRQVTAKIEEVRGIRTADCRELRYHVYLTVRHRGTAYRVLTNLNDRSRSGEKLLLGRNWLRYGFAVDPGKESEL